MGEKREERGGRSTGSRGSWERRGKKEVAEVQGVEGVGRRGKKEVAEVQGVEGVGRRGKKEVAEVQGVEGVGREQGRKGWQKCWEWMELGDKREERGGSEGVDKRDK